MALATVLGAAGFVGARLKARLEASGVEVYAPAKGDPTVFERPLGCVYYCAGLTADYAIRPFDTIEAHVGLIARLAKSATFERLVYTSSTRLYDASGAAVGDEASPLSLDPAQPRHLYDLSKALGENIALTQTGGRGAVARLANVFDWAPGGQGFLSEWLARAPAERTITLDSSPEVFRDYIHLDDVVDALMAMGGDAASQIVNVAGGQLVSNAQIAAVFERAGWSVSFAGSAKPPPPPRADILRLEALGVSPRPVLEVVDAYLSEVLRDAAHRPHA